MLIQGYIALSLQKHGEGQVISLHVSVLVACYKHVRTLHNQQILTRYETLQTAETIG